MSAGLYRKQYEALKSIAEDGLGVTIPTPDGSFNEKFCSLCRLMIEELGGTFAAIQGDFPTRKADYLRQLAIAFGLSSVEAGASFRLTFLKAARSIWTGGNDGVDPDEGASLDWRTFQYLNHATLPPAAISSIIQWLKGGTDDGLELKDKLTTVDEPTINNVQCYKFDGQVGGDWVDSGVPFNPGTSDFEIGITMSVTTAPTGYKTLMGSWGGASAGRISIHCTATKWYIILIDSTGSTVLNGSDWTQSFDTSGTPHTFMVKREGGVVDIYYDGAVVGSETVTGLSFGVTDENILLFSLLTISGQRSGPGTVYAAHYIEDGDTKFSYECEEGDGSIAYDTSGNGNDGTITVGAGGLDTFHSTADGIPSYNMLNGFSEHGIFADNIAKWDTGLNNNEVDKFEFYGSMVQDTNDSGDFYCFLSTGVNLYVNGGKRYAIFAGSGSAHASNSTDSRLVQRIEMDYSDPDNPTLSKDGVLVLTSTSVDLSPTSSPVYFTSSGGSKIKEGEFIHAKLWSGTTLKSHIVSRGGKLFDLISDAFLVPVEGSGLSMDFKRVPALTDGTDDAAGNVIASPAGFVSNNSGTDTKQTDSGTFGAGTVSFWSSDGTALDEKTKAQFDTHYSTNNGSYALWIKKIGDNISESVQYPIANELTPSEVLRNERCFGGTSGADRVDGVLQTDGSGFVTFTP